MSRPPPTPQADQALRALGPMLRGRSVLPGLEVLHRELGDIFQVPLPGFRPVVVAGPEWAHFVYVAGAGQLLWRAEQDPITRLLRGGLLVQDHAAHAERRRQLDPSLRRQLLAGYADSFVRRTDQVAEGWSQGRPLELTAEMRRIALLILAETLFGVDLTADLDGLWAAIHRVLRFISPGPWILWPGLPRIGYRSAIRTLDSYLYRLIAAKRSRPPSDQDMVARLIAAGLEDDPIRDQLLTMLIAGHDTSTALLSWTLALLGEHRQIAAEVRSEIDARLGSSPPSLGEAQQLARLGQVIQESLRLFPPIHLSNRMVASDLQFDGYRIPAGTRLMQSIYLTHRHPRYWPDPARFDPDRFNRQNVASRPPYSYLPFGGGRRNCIGSAFAMAEARVVLARLLQRFDLELLGRGVRPVMGATLMPAGRVAMLATRRVPAERVLRPIPVEAA